MISIYILLMLKFLQLISIFDHVWLVHRGHKPLFVHFFFSRTFLKNSEGNKKAEGDFSPNMDSTFGLFIVAL